MTDPKDEATIDMNLPVEELLIPEEGEIRLAIKGWKMELWSELYEET